MGPLNAKIEEYCLKLCALKDTIEEHERIIEEVTKQYNEIRMKDLAELMDNEGFEVGSSLTLKNGRIIKINSYFNASIPSNTLIEKQKDVDKREELQEKKGKCLDWLLDNNLGDIIKNEIIISLKKGENEKAKEIISEMNEKGVICHQEETVHSQTLKATLKEVVGNGKEIPFDLFNISSGTIIEVK